MTWCAAESDGEKWDLGGSGVNVMRVQMDGHWRDVVGVGGKSGVYTVLDARSGAFIWNTLIGPGGDQGGMNWGTAFDGQRIYASITNHHHIPYKLTQNGVIWNTTTTGGSWAALDPITGMILWQTADPQVETLPGLGAGDGSERCRVCLVDGQARDPGPDVRAGCGDRRDSVAVRRWGLGQCRPGRR